jgi:Kef-type K+ transport system membrane component KefB
MNHRDVVLFLTQIAAMVCAAMVFGQLARRLKQPAVLGELVGGILLGATVLGALAPGAYAWLFPPDGAASAGRAAVVKLGMLFFLFVAGQEVDLARLRGQGRKVLLVSVLGMAVPFALGFGLVRLCPGLWGAPPAGRPLLPALFMGTALSISALPVIARILMDLKLMRTELGATVMTAAMFDDLVGWLLFGMILSSAAPEGTSGAAPWAGCALVVGAFVLALTAGRWAGRRLLRWLRPRLPWPSGFIGVAAVLVLVTAAAFEAAGVHSALGAFLVGAMLAPDAAGRDEHHETISQFVTSFFGAPVYFVSVGLGVSFIESFDWRLVLAVLLVACAGKIGGAVLGARLAGMAPKPSLALAFGLNARGAMEMILASVALENGLIDRRVFVALVVMALVTSLLGGPAMQRLAAAEPRGAGTGAEGPAGR